MRAMSAEDRYETILDGCRNGKILVVAACLIEANTKGLDLIKKTYTSCEGEVYTPFLIAIRNGHNRIVSLLLDKFGVDPSEHSGSLSFDGYLIEGASPLWCAAACGHLEIVKDLIDHGANINETTSTNSTPLRAACFHGNLSVVMHLVENGADPNIANRFNNTCLMVSCYRGNLDVVEYLLKQGVDTDLQANCGGTALHFACERGHLNIIKALLDSGCSINIKNKSDLTGPMVAADACHADIVEYFTESSRINVETQIMLLELLGASFANDKEKYSLNKTYHFLYLALLLRRKENMSKQVLPPVAAYNNVMECRTVEELQAIAEDQDAIHLEALIVRERILGVTCPEVVHPIVYRGAVYADGLQFCRCIQLWKRALQLRLLNERSAHNDLLRFAEVFSQMILLGEKIDHVDLLSVLESCIEELNRVQAEINVKKQVAKAMNSELSLNEQNNLCQQIDASCAGCPNCFQGSSLDRLQASLTSAWNRLKINLHTFLYLITIICREFEQREDRHAFGKRIYQFLKQDIRDDMGNTALHLAVNEKTPVDDFHVKDVCSFPNADVVNFLLSCGADPNARNTAGNTPLHVIVQYEKPISDFITLHVIITQLLEHGGHCDVSNASRKTPVDLATTGVAEIILKTQTKVTLKCLAARALRTHAVPYEGKIPDFLKHFIEMH